MAGVTRRGFLGVLGGALAAVVVPTAGEIARFGDPERAFWRPGKKHLFLDDTKQRMLTDAQRETVKKVLVSPQIYNFKGRRVAIVSGHAEGQPIRASDWANVKVMDLKTRKQTKVPASVFRRWATPAPNVPE